MDKIKCCNVRPNICEPEDIYDLRDIGNNYVYGVQVIRKQVPKKGDISNPFEGFINYTYKQLEDRGLVDDELEVGVFIVVRPRSACDKSNISFAYMEPEYYGQRGTCTFYNGSCCTCPDGKRPYFCDNEKSTEFYADVVWGYITKGVTDAWINRQEELREIISTRVAGMTKSQRSLLLLDQRTPIGALIYLGIVDKGLF